MGYRVADLCNQSPAYVIADVIVDVTASVTVDIRFRRTFVESPSEFRPTVVPSDSSSILCRDVLMYCVLLPYVLCPIVLMSYALSSCTLLSYVMTSCAMLSCVLMSCHTMPCCLTSYRVAILRPDILHLVVSYNVRATIVRPLSGLYSTSVPCHSFLSLHHIFKLYIL
jgi:hypothetical protein